MVHLHNLIEFCFMLGLRHGGTWQLLNRVSHAIIHMCILRQILKSVGLYRGRNESDPLVCAVGARKV